MAQTKYKCAVASMSWIDPKAGLPEDDEQGDPGRVVSRNVILGKKLYRFANFLEVYIVVDDASRQILEHGFTDESRIYRAPSFAKIPSESFRAIRQVTPTSDLVIFRQTVGARTQSAEEIGKVLGSAAGPLGLGFGRVVAHWLFSFPPIWTELEMHVYADGRFAGRVLRHSLFPSMTFVEQRFDCMGGMQRAPSGALPHVEWWQASKPYDGVPNMDLWERTGYGKIPESASTVGPSPGNPWGLTKSAFAEMGRSIAGPLHPDH